MITIKDRFRGCIVGLATGDALGSAMAARTEDQRKAPVEFPEVGRYSDDTQIAICVSEALISAGQTVDGFMDALSTNLSSWFKAQENSDLCRSPNVTNMIACERLLVPGFGGWTETGLADAVDSGASSRSMPIGLYHMDDLTTTVEFGIAAAQPTHGHTSALCSSVAASLLTLVASKSVPVGTWANELMIVTQGIDRKYREDGTYDEDFKEYLELAAALAARRAPAKIAFSAKFIGGGMLAYEASAAALFSCMSHPNDFKAAVATAATSAGEPATVASIAGGWMGARLGMAAIPSEWVDRLEDAGKLVELSDRLYDAKIKPA